MKKQTAMEELIEWAISLKNVRTQCTDWIVIKNKAESLLAMEKEQIEKAFKDGIDQGFYIGGGSK
jgi:hypothetical protein